jgi:uncharacterized protein YbjT (DUF2867 family)
MTGSILVVGATGAVGAQLVAELRRRDETVRGASRDPESARRRSGDGGVEWVRFDLEQPATFAAALDDVDRVFLIARPGDDEPERVALPLVEEMRRRGVKQVANLSAMGAGERADFGLRKVELALEASGLLWTHLRPNWFMQVLSAGPLAAGLRATGALGMPAGPARISYVDVRDVAAVAATVLVAPGHEGRAYTLTGGESLDGDAVVHALSTACGRTLRYEPLDDEEAARAALQSGGLGPARVERLIGFYRLVRAGACAPVSPDVAAVLGRPPIAFARFAADHADRWR